MSNQVKVTIKEIRDAFKTGKTIFYNSEIEIETMKHDALAYCEFVLSTGAMIIKIS